MLNDNGAWHEKMCAEALSDPEIQAEYEAFKSDFELAEQLKKSRERQRLSQQAVAEKMLASKSAVVQLESADGNAKHSPSISTLRRYARAIGCHLEIKLVPDSR